MEKNVIQINGGITIIDDVSVKICQKDYIWNPYENGRHLGDSGNTCDKIIQSYNEEIKTIPRNYNEKYNW